MKWNAFWLEMERKEDDFGDCLWLWRGKEKKEKLDPRHFGFLDSLTLCIFFGTN